MQLLRSILIIAAVLVTQCLSCGAVENRHLNADKLPCNSTKDCPGAHEAYFCMNGYCSICAQLCMFQYERRPTSDCLWECHKFNFTNVYSQEVDKMVENIPILSETVTQDVVPPTTASVNQDTKSKHTPTYVEENDALPNTASVSGEINLEHAPHYKDIESIHSDQSILKGSGTEIKAEPACWINIVSSWMFGASVILNIIFIGFLFLGFCLFQCKGWRIKIIKKESSNKTNYCESQRSLLGQREKTVIFNIFQVEKSESKYPENSHRKPAKSKCKREVGKGSIGTLTSNDWYDSPDLSMTSEESCRRQDDASTRPLNHTPRPPLPCEGSARSYQPVMPSAGAVPGTPAVHSRITNTATPISQNNTCETEASFHAMQEDIQEKVEEQHHF